MSRFSAFYDVVNSWWPFVFTIIFSIVCGIRMYIRGKDYVGDSKMDGKTVLITGASSGLGFHAAKELARRGAHVILTCRDETKGEKAKKAIKRRYPYADVVLKILDVSLMHNIREFCEELSQQYERIDVLINNAGIIFHPFQKTLDGFELTMATNYFGPFLLTHCLLPLLNKSSNGRVIFLTAFAHYAGKINLEDLNSFQKFEMREVYAQSKLALLLFTKQMACLCKKTKITFNCVNPGLVRDTDHFNRSALQASLTIRFIVWPWMWLFMKSPEMGIQTVVYAAVEPTLKRVSGCYLSDCQIKRPSEAALDQYLAENLYRKTCEICDINSDFMLKPIVNCRPKTGYFY